PSSAPPGRTPAGYYLPLLLACVSLVTATASRAVASAEDTGMSSEAPSFVLAFSDDFSTDPNTNGQWMIHHYDGRRNSQSVWDSAARAWHLTRPVGGIGLAVFANYELTATTWKAQFDYRAARLGGLQNGGDGFVFMFYKNK